MTWLKPDGMKRPEPDKTHGKEVTGGHARHLAPASDPVPIFACHATRFSLDSGLFAAPAMAA
jgi:hypothetical protein